MRAVRTATSKIETSTNGAYTQQYARNWSGSAHGLYALARASSKSDRSWKPGWRMPIASESDLTVTSGIEQSRKVWAYSQ